MRANRPDDVFKYINMVNDRNACWLWGGNVDDGRPYFTFKDGKRSKKSLAYRVVYWLVYGERLPSNVLIRHTCDVPLCCNPFHLLKGTHQQNMDDMKERGRHGLPHHTIRLIRKMAEGGKSDQEINDVTDLPLSTIADIRNYKTYKDVE